jgi:hypothetical protein
MCAFGEATPVVLNPDGSGFVEPSDEQLDVIVALPRLDG